MRRLRIASITALCIGAAVLAGGCSGESRKAEPTRAQAEASSAQTEENDSETVMSIEFWHYYNDAQKQHLDQLIKEYNDTLGRERGVAVEAYSQGSIADLTNKIDLVLNGTTNDVEMANIVLAYRDMVVNTVKLHPDRLVELGSVVPESDLAQYNQAYLNEGYIDGKLYILPVAKSTELLLMNQTRLDAFLDANPRYREENMESWEGLERMAEGYFRWTDDMTPETDGDGSPFIGVDNLANYFVAMNHAMGSDIYHYDENGVVVPDLDRDIIERLFLNYYQPFTKGYYGAKGRYRSDDVKQSYLAGCIGSSSSVLYFPEEVGNMVPVTTGVYQYPVMEGTTPTAIQQGAGVAVFNRSHEENKAALDFIHWLTIDRGFELATSMSYMPVDNGAMTEEQGRQIDDARVLKGIETGLKQSSSYQMVYGFDFENSYDVRTEVDACFSEALSRGRMEFEEYLGQGMSMDEAAASMDYGRKADAFYEQVKAIFEE
jgi:multiple sugar transport system substrate-binding protein